MLRSSVFNYPEVFPASSFTGIVDKAAPAQGNAAERPGKYGSVAAVQHKRAQIHVTGLEATVNEAGRARERKYWL